MNILTMRKIKFTQLLPTLIVFVLIGCSTTQNSISSTKANEGWEIVKKDKSEEEKWILCSRKTAGSKFLEFQIVGVMNATSKQAQKAVREKMENNEKYEIDGLPIEILSNTKTELLTYSVSKMPFPFKDREMCERVKFSKNETTNTTSVVWKEAWDEAPAKKDKTIRMPIIRGSWLFVPSDSTKSKATYSVQFDPGGHIPAWMVNSMAGSFLIEELKSIEEIAQMFK